MGSFKQRDFLLVMEVRVCFITYSTYIFIKHVVHETLKLPPKKYHENLFIYIFSLSLLSNFSRVFCNVSLKRLISFPWLRFIYIHTYIFSYLFLSSFAFFHCRFRNFNSSIPRNIICYSSRTSYGKTSCYTWQKIFWRAIWC